MSQEDLVVIVDASVLSKITICDFLLRCAEKRLYKLRLTEDILEDRKREFISKGEEEAKAQHFVDEVRESFSTNFVSGYQELMPSIPIQRKHQHVLAAALACKANFIVTYNLADFSQGLIDHLGLNVITPDEFLLMLYEADRYEIMVTVTRDQVRKLTRPLITLSELLRNLERCAPEFAQLMRIKLINLEENK